MVNHHFIFVAFPAQGHINPALQLAKLVVAAGAEVTFATSVSARRRMGQSRPPPGMTFAAFSDGYDDGFKRGTVDMSYYMSEMRRNGTQLLRGLIDQSAAEGRPVTCLVYTILLFWAARVAREIHIPSALCWVQSATGLAIYYSYFRGYMEAIVDGAAAGTPIEVPGAPPLSRRDIPTFLLPGDAHAYVLPAFEEQLEALEEEPNPKILLNTFDALEPAALRCIDKFDLVAIGPLLPSAFLDGKDPSDRAFGGDLFKIGAYTEWLDSQPEKSVVYVSFGSLSVLSHRQKEELAVGLLATRRPFLWVIRATEEDGNASVEPEQELSCKDEMEKQGMIVRWCSQVEVLSHTAVGCFLTHCGWNSTLEGVVSGVPLVAFPQWTDQTMNAKLVEDVWRTGVRVAAAGEDGLVVGEEIRRCVEMVMGEGARGEEVRENARKWRELGREAVMDGRSSDRNLRKFMDQLQIGC